MTAIVVVWPMHACAERRSVSTGELRWCHGRCQAGAQGDGWWWCWIPNATRQQWNDTPSGSAMDGGWRVGQGGQGGHSALWEAILSHCEAGGEYV